MKPTLAADLGSSHAFGVRFSIDVPNQGCLAALAPLANFRARLSDGFALSGSRSARRARTVARRAGGRLAPAGAKRHPGFLNALVEIGRASCREGVWDAV